MAEGDRLHSDPVPPEPVEQSPPDPPAVPTEPVRRSRTRRVTTGLAVLVVVVLLLAGAAWRLDLGQRWGPAAPTVPAAPVAPDPVRDPAAVAPPPGLDLPTPAPAAPVARPLPEREVSAAAVREALGRLPGARRLGPRLGLVVAGADGRPVLAGVRPWSPRPRR